MEETMMNSTEELDQNTSSAETMDTETMILGFQVCCKTVLDKIIATKRKPGKTSMNDYKRLIKDLEEFCFTGLSISTKTDEKTESTGNSTKLMEEENGL